MTGVAFADGFDAELALPEDRALCSMKEAARQALARRGLSHFVGVSGSGPALLAKALATEGAARVVYIAPEADTARRAAADLTWLTSGAPVEHSLLKPMTEAAEPLLVLGSESGPYAEVHPDRRAAMVRASSLFRIAAGLPWSFLVTTAAAFIRRVMPPTLVREAGAHVVREGELDLASTASRLVAAGYLRAPVVEDPGSFAIRGGVLDVWPPGTARPVRVEMFGDIVASLRTFDPDDQRTVADIDAVWLVPAREAIVTERTVARAQQVVRGLCDRVNFPSVKARQLVEDVSSGKPFFGSEGFLPAFADLVPLWSYLTPGTALVVEDGSSVLAALREELGRAQDGARQRAQAPHFEPKDLFASEDEVAAALADWPVAVTHRAAVHGRSAAFSLDALESVPLEARALTVRDQSELARAIKTARATQGKARALDPLIERVQAWRENGLVTVITARGATQAQRLARLLEHRDVAVRLEETRAPGSVPASGSTSTLEAVHVVIGALARGGLALTSGLALLTEEEVFGHRAHRQQSASRAARAMLEDLRALEPGDYVVHVEHGVGRYLGLARQQIQGHAVELISVEYLGGDKLFLPVYRLNQIQKYAGADSTPRLDRLGGASFAKTKAKVKRKVRQMADELLRLYAERASLRKPPLPAPDDDYAAFEATFPYEETRDQAQAIADVMRDLTDEGVMDRLVCGDVGFGKTEVALRAAFRCALAGRQVALLCPTTVLAQQHFLTFSTRLQDYPITVRALSRFQSKSDQADTLRGLRSGGVDIVIGTHRLLSKDVHFKNLGLLVVDEEQRFGVSHKERIKQIRASVDALTLTATPIPRTLQMAVTGLRDMSLITTPPVDRRAIRTVTSRFDERLIAEAIRRELERGGQVFYVYNRVEGLYERAARLNALVPEARIAVGHGQMSETALERTMLEFVGGAHDVLVSTAIIESGIDIPRANTIIVDRADLFGLSQLYQLRGRVGRSSERAYAYLLVPPPSELTEEARSRIEALERYTELGAGFQIATLDMELRGAGELLGAEQSGFAASVGFDLFCHMLEEATRELRGEVVVPEVEPELSFDVEALIPEDYVSEIGVRLSLYKRLASALDDGEVAEIASEMEDRFGQAPQEVLRLVEMMRLKTELRRLRVLGVQATSTSVTLHLRDDTPLDPARVGALAASRRGLYRLTPDARLTRRLAEGENAADGLVLADRLLSEIAGCVAARA